jgi:hypothetical protein
MITVHSPTPEEIKLTKLDQFMRDVLHPQQAGWVNPALSKLYEQDVQVELFIESLKNQGCVFSLPVQSSTNGDWCVTVSRGNEQSTDQHQDPSIAKCLAALPFRKVIF